MNKQKWHPSIILTAFALSGMTALIYEVVWARSLQLIFGSTIYAVSTILTTFFVGFALGSYAFRNLADRTGNPGRLFALLELAIGLYGLIILYLFKILPSVYLYLTGMPGVQFAQFFILFLVLITPATLFGATWPVISRIYANNERLGSDIGRLYSSNSFGSFIGPMATGFFLIPLMGIMATAIVAASINLLIALTIFALSGKMKGAKDGS